MVMERESLRIGRMELGCGGRPGEMLHNVVILKVALVT